MDQVKIYLALLKKHHFWVMCGIIFITSIMVYSMGTTELDNQRKARESAISTAKGNQEKILSGWQANDRTIDKYRDKNKEVSKGVEEAWVKLYWTQRGRLTWPVDMATFKEDLDKWQETIPARPFDEDQRRTYQTVMTQSGERNRLKKLIQIYQETKVPNPRKGLVHESEVRPSTKAPGKGAGPQEDFLIVPVGLVRWGNPAVDQQGNSATGVDVIFRDYKWVEKTTPPTSLEMLYTQEDLWVYEFLLEALSKVNVGIDPNRPEKALLKEIVDLRIGQQAIVAPTTNLTGDLAAIVGAVAGPEGQPGGGLPGGYPPPGIGGPPVSNEMNRGMGPPGTPGATATVNTDDLLKSGRYCDLDMKPIMASEFAEKIEKDQYRLMPVYLRLVLNQQKLPALMTELSTAVMPMRIKQVQLYKTDATPPAAQQGPAGQAAAPTVDPRFSMDVGVEIRGFVHIYQIPATKTFPHRADAEPGVAGGVVAPGTGLPAPVVTGDPTAAPTVIVPGTVPAPTVTVPGTAPAPTPEEAAAPAPGTVSPVVVPPTVVPPTVVPPAVVPPAGAAPAPGTN